MNKNTLLFILLSSVILMGASILQSNSNPPTPEPNTEVVEAGGAAGDQAVEGDVAANQLTCLLYTSPSPRDKRQSRMPSSA